MDFDEPNYERREYNKWEAYGQSKTANALFAVGLDHRLKDRGVRAFSVHPGAIMTELSRHMQQQDYEDLTATLPPGESMEFKSVEQGSATSVWGATSPDLEKRGGLYLEDCHVADPGESGGRGGIQDYAIDPVLAERLWTLSEQLVGQTFDI
jgi:hypothetical protein